MKFNRDKETQFSQCAYFPSHDFLSFSFSFSLFHPLNFPVLSLSLSLWKSAHNLYTNTIARKIISIFFFNFYSWARNIIFSFIHFSAVSWSQELSRYIFKVLLSSNSALIKWQILDLILLLSIECVLVWKNLITNFVGELNFLCDFLQQQQNFKKIL